VSLDPTRVHDQAGVRPALVLTVDAFNASPAGLVTVLPLTSKPRAVRTRVEMRPRREALLYGASLLPSRRVRFRRSVSSNRSAR